MLTFIDNQERLLQRGKKIKTAAFAIAGIFALAGIILLFLQIYAGFAGAAAAAAAGLITGFVMGKAKTGEKDFPDLLSAKKAISQWEIEKSSSDFASARYSDEFEHFNQQKAVCDQLAVQLEEIIKPWGASDIESAKRLAIQLEEGIYAHERLNDKVKAYRANYESLTNHIDLSALERAAGEYSGETAGDISDISAELETTRIRQREALAQYTECEREGARITGRTPSEVFEDIEKTKRKLKSCELGQASINKAIEILNQVYDEIQSVFAPSLNESAGQLLSDATDGKYDSVLIDKNFRVGIRCSGVVREIGYFSSGTKDAVYLALRLSLLKLLVNEQFPIILDDTFTQFDDKRLSATLDFFVKMMRDQQLILLTCHGREKQILERLKHEYNSITL
jgi:hypothetical protein